MMNATIPNVAAGVSNARNLAGDKETTQFAEAVCVDSSGDICNPVSVRWYMGRSNTASVVKCSIWIHSHPIHCSGHGSAGGYGYCKMSAAFDEAVRSAGIELSEDIHGRGEGKVREAIIAICEAVYPGYPASVVGSL